MNNLLIEIVAALVISLFAYAGYSRFFRPLLTKLREALRPMEDQWTWTKRDGALFEDVDVEGIEADKVIFQHKSGRACVPIVLLSEDSRLKLARGYQLAAPPAVHAMVTKTVERAFFDTEAGKQEKVAEHRSMIEKGSPVAT